MIELSVALYPDVPEAEDLFDLPNSHSHRNIFSSGTLVFRCATYSNFS